MRNRMAGYIYVICICINYHNTILDHVHDKSLLLYNGIITHWEIVCSFHTNFLFLGKYNILKHE